MTADLYETLKLVAQGLPNAEVALRLGVGESAVKDRVLVLRRRFGARNRTHLMALCHREMVV